MPYFLFWWALIQYHTATCCRLYWILIPGPVVRNSLRCGHCHWTWDQLANWSWMLCATALGIIPGETYREPV